MFPHPNGLPPDTTGIPSRVFGLAPMEGITDFPMRLWLSFASVPDFIITPFLRVTPGYQFKSIPKGFCPELFPASMRCSSPCIPQLMASDPSDIVRVAKPILERVPFVDINCGCPSPTVVGNGGGSALLRSPDAFFSFLYAIQNGLGERRFSVKMRLGDSSPSEFDNLLHQLTRLRPAALFLHGRTRKELYTGSARWDPVEQAATTLESPVFGSGDLIDICSRDSSFSAAPHAAGALIGRGALRNPWIFTAVRSSSMPNISPQCLLWAICVFAVLEEIWARAPHALTEYAFSEKLAQKWPAHDPQHWANLFAQLQQIIRLQTHPRELPVQGKTLARIKMLWKYLRTDLHQEFLDLPILRSITFTEIWDTLAESAAHSQRTHVFDDDSVTRHSQTVPHSTAQT